MRTSAIDRQLARPFNLNGDAFAPPNTLPPQWTAAHVRTRLVEAFEIDRRLPNGRLAPLRSTWRLATIDTFADKVAQGELASEYVLEQWARSGSVTAPEVTRWEEAFGWPGKVLAERHPAECRCLLAWAACIAFGRPLARELRKRGWARSTFLRRAESGAERIAGYLNERGVLVR